MEFPIHFYRFSKLPLARFVRDSGFHIDKIGDSFAGQSTYRPTSGILGPLSRILMAFGSPFGMLCAMLGSGKAIIAASKPAATVGSR